MAALATKVMGDQHGWSYRIADPANAASMTDKLPETLSHRIALTRVLCIAGMIYVHVPTLDNNVASYLFDVSDLFGSVQGFLVEGYGRAGASLLSVVSGFLTARVLLAGRRTAWHLYMQRFWSILIPMMLWGTLTLLLYWLVSMVLTRPTFLDAREYQSGFDLLQYANVVLFVTEMPVGPTMHLGFLRDLFMCIVLSPLLLFALRLAWLPGIVALLLVYLLDIESVIVLRPLIILCFAIGMLLVIKRVNVTALDSCWPVWLASTVLVTLLILLYNAGNFGALDSAFRSHQLDAKESLLYPACRLFGALTLWTLSAQLLGTRVAGFLISLMPYIFVAYCSHYIVLTLLFFGIWHPVLNGGHGVLYGVWFLTAPAVAIAAAWCLLHLMMPWLPGLARVITGGRTLSRVS